MNKIAKHNETHTSLDFSQRVVGRFATVLADPPWRFENRTGKMAPEHQRLLRYPTMSVEAICDLPIQKVAAESCHLYLWVPNALVAEGLMVMKSWGFTYKSNIVWYKTRKDGGPDGRGVGFYFRNVTELILFGIRGRMRTLPPGRRQTNIIVSRKREHSRKPDEIYQIVESCSPGPYLELFARFRREKWHQWGNENLDENSLLDVAMRNGHSNATMRLFEPPSGYCVKKNSRSNLTKKT